MSGSATAPTTICESDIRRLKHEEQDGEQETIKAHHNGLRGWVASEHHTRPACGYKEQNEDLQGSHSAFSSVATGMCSLGVGCHCPLRRMRPARAVACDKTGFAKPNRIAIRIAFTPA